jgi:hypothetical protein
MAINTVNKLQNINSETSFATVDGPKCFLVFLISSCLVCLLFSTGFIPRLHPAAVGDLT